MTRIIASALFMATLALPALAEDNGFATIFDGKTLDGWDGDPKFWSVEDDAITGQTTKENPTQGNTFIVWEKGELGDFELLLEYKIQGGNSGIQYRSFHKSETDPYRIGGYQADFEAGDTYSGICYGEAFRGMLSKRGEKTTLSLNDAGKLVRTVEKFGDSSEIGKAVKKGEWNEYRIVAKDYTFTHYINGVKTTELIDNDEKSRLESGVLALQLHAGPPMKVQFRNIRLKRAE